MIKDGLEPARFARGSLNTIAYHLFPILSFTNDITKRYRGNLSATGLLIDSALGGPVFPFND